MLPWRQQDCSGAKLTAAKSEHRWGRIFFLLGLFCKQFYLLPSGVPQLGDILMLTGALAGIWHSWQEKRRGIVLWLLTIWCMAVDLFWAIRIRDGIFLRSGSYLIYNALLVTGVRCLGNGGDGRQDGSLVLIGALALQTLIRLGVGQHADSAVGRWYGGKLVRYMGTFNDPNQLAFYVFSAFLLIMRIAAESGREQRSRRVILRKTAAFGMSLFLIVQSASAGMALGMTVWILCVGTRRLLCRAKGGNRQKDMAGNRREWMGAAAANLSEFLQQSRLLHKIARYSHSGSAHLLIRQFIRDRSLGKILAYPEYLLLGAGDGRYDRFPLPGIPVNEPHCTIAAVWFAYGIPGAVLFLLWIGMGIYEDLQDGGRTMPERIALLVESCTLLNYRQPFFWMILM